MLGQVWLKQGNPRGSEGRRLNVFNVLVNFVFNKPILWGFGLCVQNTIKKNIELKI